MSEQQASATPTSTPETPVSGAIPSELAPNTVIHHQDPATQPAQPAQPAPEVPQDYRINLLENGQQEVTLNSGQVYRGTAEQVINELAKAQFHASRRITELSGQIPAAPVVEQTGPYIDPTAKALADLVAQGEGYRDSADKMAQQQDLRDFYQQQQYNAIASNFIASTPDFFPSVENGKKVEDTLNAFNLPPTPDAIALVHNHLKATGQYVIPPQSQQVQRSPAMPMPPNGMQPAVAGPITEDAIWAMSPQEFAAYEQRLRTR